MPFLYCDNRSLVLQLELWVQLIAVPQVVNLELNWLARLYAYDDRRQCREDNRVALAKLQYVWD